MVDGVVYRWTVSRRPSCSQALGDSPLSFAVELLDDPAGRLLVSLPVARPDNWLELPSGAVTPALVARCITEARDARWDAGRRGPALRVRLPVQAAK